MEEKIRLINADCYTAIKDIPDKSIDLVYIDVPYQFEQGGGGGAFGTKKRPYRKEILLSDNTEKLGALKAKVEKYKRLMAEAKSQEEYNKWHSYCGNEQKKIAYLGIDNGFDFAILDDLCRVMKNIYIYIYGAARNRYIL